MGAIPGSWDSPGQSWGVFHVCEERLQPPKHSGDLENEAKLATFMSMMIQMITCVSLFLQIVFLRLLHTCISLIKTCISLSLPIVFLGSTCEEQLVVI